MATISDGDPVASVGEAIQALAKLRSVIGKIRSVQVTRAEHRELIKATALAWSRSQRKSFGATTGLPALEAVDGLYKTLLVSADRATSRDRYKQICRRIKEQLVQLRSDAVDLVPRVSDDIVESMPDFGSLVTDPAMKAILAGRWEETRICLRGGAHLAATVMMGSILEALFLTRANHLADKTPLFKARTTPKDRSGKPLSLSDWTLKSYIDVAHEIGWIRQSARDVSIVLRDWRNYIHPAKQLAHATSIEAEDTSMFWTVFWSLAVQILKMK